MGYSSAFIEFVAFPSSRHNEREICAKEDKVIRERVKERERKRDRENIEHAFSSFLSFLHSFFFFLANKRNNKNSYDRLLYIKLTRRKRSNAYVRLKPWAHNTTNNNNTVVTIPIKNVQKSFTIRSNSYYASSSFVSSSFYSF